MQVDFSDLSAYMDGELRDREKRKAVEAQIAESPVYAAEYERIRGTHSLMAAQIVHPGFHRQLMERAQKYEKRASWDGPIMRWVWRGTAAAATAAAAAIVATYTGVIDFGVGPITGGRISISDSGGPDSLPTSAGMVNVAEGERAPLPPAPGVSATGQPQVAAMPFTLISTAGASKSAVLERIDTHESKTYRVGDTVMPNVKLADVRYGQVVLETNGIRHILSATGVADESLAGLWEFRTTGTNGEPLIATIVEQGETIYLTGENGQAIANGVRTGPHVSIFMPTDRGRVRIEGDLREGAEELVLTGVVPTGDADQPNFKLNVRARRLESHTQ